MTLVIVSLEIYSTGFQEQLLGHPQVLPYNAENASVYLAVIKANETESGSPLSYCTLGGKSLSGGFAAEVLCLFSARP